MKAFISVAFAKRSVALLLCLVMAVCCVLGACNNNTTGGATSDSATTDATTEAIDTSTFVFADGVTVGGADISGMSFDTAFQAVEVVALDTVKDFKLTVVAGEDTFDYDKDNFQWQFAIEEALMQAAQFVESEEAADKTDSSDTTGTTSAPQGEFALSVEVKTESVDTVVAQIAEKVDVAAVDATIVVDGDKVNISREKVGKQLDKEDLSKKIIAEANALATGEKKNAKIEAVINDVEPENKFEDFDGEIKLISTFTTYSTNTANGNHNMRLALEACDGSIINPGEVWSFNECTGNSNLESLGYLPATVIAGGEYQQGIGGGLCQSSTTIYNAALLANMEIVERYYHYYQSSYAAAGRDATIDYPYLDLKLSNPTEYPMYMQCYMEGTVLTVNIYGWDDPAFDKIEIESAVYSSDSEGYNAKAERVYYLDGKEVGRESLPNSRYAYPDSKEDETTKATEATKATKATKPKATKPAATKPQATKPVATKPAETTPKATVPQVTQPAATKPADPVEPTQVITPQATQATSLNEEQIETAIMQY